MVVLSDDRGTGAGSYRVTLLLIFRCNREDDGVIHIVLVEYGNGVTLLFCPYEQAIQSYPFHDLRTAALIMSIFPKNS